MMNNENNDNILDLIRSALQTHSVTLFMPTEDNNYSLVSSSVEYEPYINENTIITLGKGLVGWIARHQHPLTLSTFDKQQRCLHFYSEQDEKNITSFMGCPVPNGGIICVDSVTDRKFNEYDQALLHRFAKLLARHIQSMDSIYKNQKTHTFYDGLKKLIELSQEKSWSTYIPSFLQIIAEATGSDYAVFTSSIEETSSYTVECENVPLAMSNTTTNIEIPFTSGGLIGWVFRNEVPVYAEGSEGSSTPIFGKQPHIPTFQSIICLPVSITKNTCGVLCLASKTAKPLPQDMRIFTNKTVLLLEQFLENITLKHKVKSQLPNISTLHKNGAVFYDPDVHYTQNTDDLAN